MQDTVMKKLYIMPWLFCLMLVLVPTAALPWDAATHTYIEEHFYKMQGQLNKMEEEAGNAALYNRIYGATALDIFNNNFTSPYLAFANYLHDTSTENFLEVWEDAVNTNEKAFAYGFVGHNNTWGMDSTAHISGVTRGRDDGYVIAKAQVLANELKPMLQSQGLDFPDEVLLNICHYFVESGVDFLVRGLDPSIGDKLMVSAQERSGEVPALLKNAYADDFSGLAGISQGDAEQIIGTAELNFRSTMIAYGWALRAENSFADALDLVAGGLAQFGANYLSYLGYPPIPEATLKTVAKGGIVAAMTLCTADFEAELKATIGRVNGRLSSKGIVWQ